MSKLIWVIIIVGIVVYFNSLFNGFVWDDEEQVVNNTLIHSITNLPLFFQGSTFNTGGSGELAGLYYKPMLSTIFSLIYTFFGSNPFFFHLFQVLLHIFNGVLVFYLFKYFFKEKLSFILALIFLIHPINTETVSYVSALQEVLFFIFGLSALLYVKRESPHNNLKYIQIIVAVMLPILLLVLSLLSKESGILFLFIIPTFIFFFQRKSFFISLPVVTVSLTVYLVLRLLADKISLVAQGPSPLMLTTFGDRLLTAPKIIFYYLKTALFPKDLSIAQHWVVKSMDFNHFFLPLAAVIFLFFLISIWEIFLWQKDKKLFKISSFFLIWFALGLLLHLQIIPLDMTVADRWFYFPAVGFLGIIGTLLVRFKAKISPKVYLPTCFLIILLLSTRTVIRNSNWKDGLILFSHDIKLQQESFDLENNLGVELFRVGKDEEAEVHFQNSTKLASHWWTNWSNLGVAAERQGEIQVAKDYYQKAIINGNYYRAYENLAGLLLFKENNPAQAAEFAQTSLKVLPLNQKLWLVLVLSYYQLGDKEKALATARDYFQTLPNQQSYYLYDRLQKSLPLVLQ